MTVFKRASFDGGADGATLTTTTEPALTSVGGAGVTTHSTAQALHGARGALTAAGATSLLRLDPTTAQGRLFWHAYQHRVGTNTATTVFAIANDPASTTTASLAMNAAGNILLRNGSTNVATSTLAVPAGGWVRYEWDINRAASTQTLTIHTGANLESATVSETLTGACTAGTGTVGWVTWGVNSGTTGAQFGYDDAAVADALVGPWTAPPAGPAVTVWDGTSEVTGAVTVWDGATEVAASAGSVT